MFDTDLLFLDSHGVSRHPTDEADWSEWVSATRTRNHVLGDPILDWLGLFGDTKGHMSDDRIPNYDERTDFQAFIFEKGRHFEAAVLALLQDRMDIVQVANSSMDSQSEAAALETYRLICDGVPAVWQGVLRNPQNLTYGTPDLLIRSDVLEELFPGSVGGESADLAPGLGDDSLHYRVVDVKFTTLNLLSSGMVGNSESKPAYKVQLYIYNQALARLQNYLPGEAYLLGRRWRQGSGTNATKSDTCLDRLGSVDLTGTLSGRRAISESADEAVAWIKSVRKRGSEWDTEPVPSVPELYPNMNNRQSQPWSAAKSKIAVSIDELTQVWNVGIGHRAAAHANNVYKWTDPNCDHRSMGMNDTATASKIDSILQINRGSGELVAPAHVDAGEAVWRNQNEIKFFVDFETVNDLDDDFSDLPVAGGQALIFMIGCGHYQDGQWEHSTFTVRSLKPENERNIVKEWLEHMGEVSSGGGLGTSAPLIHWTAAEPSMFENAYNSARSRHSNEGWPDLNWFDLHRDVFLAQPVLVKGAFGFGLKQITNALYAQGVIDVEWGDGPTDGQGAMVGAWRADQQAIADSVQLNEIDLMKEIEDYNQADCRALAEITKYLAQKH